MLRLLKTNLLVNFLFAFLLVSAAFYALDGDCSFTLRDLGHVYALDATNLLKCFIIWVAIVVAGRFMYMQYFLLGLVATFLFFAFFASIGAYLSTGDWPFRALANILREAPERVHIFALAIWLSLGASIGCAFMAMHGVKKSD